MGHHYIPRWHLAKFQDPGRPGRIWQHDKRGGAPKLAAILNVAQARNFYPESVETRLANEVEAPGNQAIAKLLDSRQLDEAERVDVARYVAAMIKRVPRQRRWADETYPEILDQVIGDARGRLRQAAAEGVGDPDLIAGRIAEFDRLHAKYSRERPPDLVERIYDPMPTEKVLRALGEMTWRVLSIADGPLCFVTTDNPAFWFREQGFGLGIDEAEISFPLSSRRVLHGSYQRARSKLSFVVARPVFVREINRRLISDAERFVFYHRPAPWIDQILAKKSHHLRRIGWGGPIVRADPAESWPFG